MSEGDFSIRLVSDPSTVIPLIRRVGLEEKGWPIESYPEIYKEKSSMWAAYDGERVVGVVMVIFGDPQDFPIRSAEGWPDLTLPPGSSAEIPFVLVDKEYRGSSGVSYMLCAATYWFFTANEIEFVELTLDSSLLQFYKFHGMNMQVVNGRDGGGIKNHWSEPGIFPARLYVGSENELGSWASGVQQTCPRLWEVFQDFCREQELRANA